MPGWKFLLFIQLIFISQRVLKWLLENEINSSITISTGKSTNMYAYIRVWHVCDTSNHFIASNCLSLAMTESSNVISKAVVVCSLTANALTLHSYIQQRKNAQGERKPIQTLTLDMHVECKGGGGNNNRHTQPVHNILAPPPCLVQHKM